MASTCTTCQFPFWLVDNHKNLRKFPWITQQVICIKLHFLCIPTHISTLKIGVYNLQSNATSISRLFLSSSHHKRLWKARTCQLHTHNYYYMYLTHLIDPNYSLCSRTNTHNLCPINCTGLNFDSVFLLPFKSLLQSRRFR